MSKLKDMALKSDQGKGKSKPLRLKDLDMSVRVADRKEYERQLMDLQLLMLRVQQAYYHEKKRAIIVMEGWDASGKGGTIRRLTERLDPRGCKVWPIAAPKAEEQGRHYLYRFWQKLPEPCTMAIFDRSWYGRVLVERVEKYAQEDEWRRAYDEINQFERMLTDDGVHIVKLFMHITPEEQLNRFAERLRNPYKRWKITEEDIRNRERWTDYEAAIEDMFQHTSTAAAPWYAIPGNQKWYVRLETLNVVTRELSKNMRLTPPPVDPVVQLAACERLGLDIVTDIKVNDVKKDKKKAKKSKKD